MKTLRAASLTRVMVTIVASAPLVVASAVTACGGATTAGSDFDNGSSGTSGSSGASGSSGDRGCGVSVGNAGTATVPFQPLRCSVDDAGDGSAASDAGDATDADAATDAGDAGDAAANECESMSTYCYRVCSGVGTPGAGTGQCSITKNSAGEKVVVCSLPLHPCGRAHDGLAPLTTNDGPSPTARWLEAAAYLEDASVTSFELLARELAAHGAPSDLVRGAARSARDEVRHARVMSALVQRHGGRTQRASKPSRGVRELRVIALENAIEGCVNETFGALLAWHQAAHAADPKVRAAMTVIARDETEHAALAWRVASWAAASLDEATRADLERARAAAWSELDANLATEPDPSAAHALGLPSSIVARAMLEALRTSIDERGVA